MLFSLSTADFLLLTRGDSISKLIKLPAHFFLFVNPFFENSLTFFAKKEPSPFFLLFLTENLQAQNFGRELVFSADLCYNGANEKPRPLGEVAAKPTERANGGKNTPSHPLSRELSHGESLWMRATLGVWALPDARVACNAVIQMRNWR